MTIVAFWVFVLFLFVVILLALEAREERTKQEWMRKDYERRKALRADRWKDEQVFRDGREQ